MKKQYLAFIEWYRIREFDTIVLDFSGNGMKVKLPFSQLPNDVLVDLYLSHLKSLKDETQTRTETSK